MRKNQELIKEVATLSTNEFLEIYESEKNEDDKKALLYARCATDLELFAAVWFPHYCQSEFNDFHVDFFGVARFGERKVRRARAAPRGSAKSTLASFIKPIHDTAYGLETFIVFISNTAPLSERKLKDIRDEIINNHDLVEFYGLVFAKSNPGETQFIVENGDGEQTLFMAFGRGAQIRGVRFGPHRPSKVVIDDAEHSDEVYNEAVRLKTLDWFREDVSKVGDPKTNFEVVGTILHRESLLANILANPRYQGKIFKSVISWSPRTDLWNEWRELYNNIDNDKRIEDARAFFEARKDAMLEGTQVLWPDREPYYDLMEEMVEIGRRAFFKEKQNEPLGAEDKIFEQIHYYREVKEGLQIESNGIIVPWSDLKGNGIAAMDPATGSKGQTKPRNGKLGDFTAMGCGWHDSKRRVFVHADWTKRASPTKYIDALFELWERWQFERMGIEINLFRNLLLPNIQAEQKRRDGLRKTKSEEPINLKFYEVEATENKEERIYRMEPKVSNGWILFNRTLSQEAMNQLTDFPHAPHDDFPDCVEILWNMVHNRYRPAGVAVNAMGR